MLSPIGRSSYKSILYIVQVLEEIPDLESLRVNSLQRVSSKISKKTQIDIFKLDEDVGVGCIIFVFISKIAKKLDSDKMYS